MKTSIDGSPEVDLGDCPYGGSHEDQRIVKAENKCIVKPENNVVTSTVFQKALTNALRFKDAEIDKLRKEIMRLTHEQ